MQGQRGLSWEADKVYDWKNYVIPARPSESELKVVEGCLKKLKKSGARPKVAVLGSTVEFRSLCHRHGAGVTVIEFRKKHYGILSLQPMEFRGKETLREEDWRSMGTSEKYGLILGDLCLNGISAGDAPAVLSNVSKSLATEGTCILRTWVRRNSRRLDAEKVIKEHRKKRPRTHIYTSCVMPFYMCFYDFKNDRVDYKAMSRGLREQLEKGNVSKREYDYCHSRWRLEGSESTIPLKPKLERLLARHFRIKRIAYGHDCFRLWAPLYVLGRKRDA